MTEFTNRLINETSPYLLQHAHNPVDWYPWGEEAFKRAKEEDKPIFLSVGYSACHWCHVMEHESFEDKETADLMNKLFINIKVDREERPDVDTIYMNVVQMLTGHGGWPMSVFMSPDKQAYYGGTYFPKNRRYHMPTFKEVLVSVSNYYHNKKDNIEKNSKIIMEQLKSINSFKSSDTHLSYDIIEKSISQLENYFDYDNGGFGSKPKFPNTFNLDLFLRHYKNTNEKKYLDMVELTLKKMSNGGLYDQLGGGFYRYSVDEIWLIPHFEKMLYDNSLLIKLLLEVYQITKNDFYKNKAEESLEYVLREMYQENGGFYSTQDADSEKEEGKFYVWTPQEIKEVLGDKDAELFCDFFDISSEGNFEHGKSNLQTLFSYEEFALKKSLNIDDIKKIIESSKVKLFNYRTKRIYPAKDTKVLTSWNGLMISAFAKGYQVLKNEKYLKACKETINFIFNKMYKKNLLLRTYKDNQSKLNAYLEDYAFFIQGLIDVHQVTLEQEFLDKAIELNKVILEQFWDEKEGGFFFTGKSHEELIVKTKEILDHSIPSSNAIALYNLIRLFRLTEDKDLEEKINKTIKAFSQTVNKYQSGVASFLTILDLYFKLPSDLILVGDNVEEIKPFLDKIADIFNTNTIIHFHNQSNDSLEMYKGKNKLDNKHTAYLCENLTCKSPINSPENLYL
ncbi:MAG: thioredoxin domain-containing protein [Candidatus Sericytochromatia bacterium]